MKKIFLPFLFLLMTLLTTSCQVRYENIDSPILPEKEFLFEELKSSELGIQTVIEEYDNYTLAVHYPVTGYSKVDQTVYDFAQNRIELYHQEVAKIQKSNEEKWPYELHIDYEVIYQSEKHYSILFTESKFLGGAQSTSKVFTYNFNLYDNRILALKDLFKSSTSYLEIISQFTYDALINNNSLNVSLDENWVLEGTQPLESNFKNFLIKENSIMIILEKYQIGSAFIGELYIDIPYDVFVAYIELKEVTLKTSDITDTTTIVQTEPYTNTPQDNNIESTTAEIISSSELPIEEQLIIVPRKKIAITFDDGPHPVYTPLILDTLKSRNEKATFFLLGNRVAAYADIVKRIFDEGHLIANHSWSHAQLTRLTNERVSNQIRRTQDSIYAATDFTPYIYRPPYGAYNENVISLASMPAVLWSINPLDLIYPDSDYITNYVLDHAIDGGIILLHDNNASTTQALGSIIDGLILAGYEIVTVDELLDLTPENASQNVRIFSRKLE